MRRHRRTMHPSPTWTGLLLGLLLTAGCGRSEPATEAASRAPAKGEAPIVSVTSADILERVRNAPGQAVLVNVWATWCVPCREEFPDLVRLKRELGKQGFELYLVSADFDLEDGVRDFLAEQGVDFETYFKDEKDMPFIETMHPEWSGALPASFLYDDTGRLVHFWQGKASYEDLHAEIESILQHGTRPTTPSNGGTAS